MSPAFMSRRLVIASERVMEPAPLERVCRSSVNGRCGGRTKPAGIKAGALHEDAVFSKDRILTLVRMSIIFGNTQEIIVCVRG
jgi:hypothetical protein